MSSWITLMGTALLLKSLPGGFGTQPDPLLAGSHNTVTITACTNYNPEKLSFTTPPSGGVPPYTYQWLTAAAADGPWSAIAGATDNFYDPPNLVLSGTWCYSCRVTDQTGCLVTTKPKMIIIVPDPTVTASGGGVYMQNSRAELAGEVTGGAGTVSLQWYASLTGISGWVAFPGATAPKFNPPTATTGILYYRLRAEASGAACSKPWSAVLPVIVIADTTQPTFEVPDTPLIFCVEPITSAHYQFPGIEITCPDCYRFRTGDCSFDLDTAGFRDDCAVKSGFTIRWLIGEADDPVAWGTGQPSGHPGFDIAGSPDRVVWHTMTWWITDCNGNESLPQTRTLSIHPRPHIIMN